MSTDNFDRSRWLILQRKLAEHRISKIFKTLRQHGIEPILIKGWAAGLKYPQPWERNFSDIDIAVEPSAYERALRAASEIADKNNLAIDLHKGLRHLDALAWDDLYVHSRLVPLTGAPEDLRVRILREEDHLRVLCVHWLTDGGAFKEKLLDIYHAVNNRSPEFDWERCLNIVSARRRRWIICTIGLTHQYYGLGIDDLPFAAEARKLPTWILRALEKEWRSGLRLVPLNNCLHDKKMLFNQVMKRIPPNPINATIEMEGKLDGGYRRFFYQLGAFKKRLMPSVRKFFAKSENT